MKLTLNKRTFSKHLEKVTKAINSASVLPSLQGVLIEASESNIKLIGSDGNFAIKDIIENNQETKVIEPGKILVPGKLFKEVIAKQGQVIDIEIESSKVIISSEGSKTNINLLNPDDYPVISFDTFGKDFVVDAKQLRKLIKDVSFAAAFQDKRIILNGVNLDLQNGKLTATATNSFRLAQGYIDIDSDVEFNITILSKNLKEFLPQELNEDVTINIDDTRIITKTNSTTILSKLIDGIYPDVSKLIPNEFNNVLTINERDLLVLVDRATVVANENKKIIKLTLSNDELVIESKRSEIGDTKVRTKEFKYQGEAFDIAFEASFLKDALSPFEKEVTLNFIGSQKQFVIKGESNKNVTQLILPHRSY